MERLKRYFEDQDLSPADIPKAIVIHEVISVAIAGAAWGACYCVRPSSRFFKPVNTAVRKHSIAEKAYSRAHMQAQKTVAKLPWLKRLPGGKDTGRLTISLAESICFRAAIKPVTFPFKLWASYKLVLATHPRQPHAITQK